MIIPLPYWEKLDLVSNRLILSIRLGLDDRKKGTGRLILTKNVKFVSFTSYKVLYTFNILKFKQIHNTKLKTGSFTIQLQGQKL